MLWFSAWNADRLTNWNLYFRAPSSFWNAATWASVGVGRRYRDRAPPAPARRRARRHQLGDDLVGRPQHLAAQGPALLHRRELALEVHPGPPGVDHVLHDLERGQGPAEPRLGVG